MKKRILGFVLVLSIIWTFMPCVNASLMENSNNWTNLTATEADDLLYPSRNKYEDSFIFVFYRQSCSYSSIMLPLIDYYAKLNNLQIYGLDDDDYDWSRWGNFVDDSSIGFPLIIVYNKDKDKFYADHSVRSEKAFLEFMSKAGYDLKTKNEIRIKIGSKKMTCSYGTIDIDVPACIIDNRTMLPLRSISESLGARVEWIKESKGIRISRAETDIWMNVGAKYIDVRKNGDSRVETLDISPQIIDSRTLVPIRAITEAFGYDVEWDQKTQTATIKLN